MDARSSGVGILRGSRLQPAPDAQPPVPGGGGEGPDEGQFAGRRFRVVDDELVEQPVAARDVHEQVEARDEVAVAEGPERHDADRREGSCPSQSSTRWLPTAAVAIATLAATGQPRQRATAAATSADGETAPTLCVTVRWVESSRSPSGAMASSGAERPASAAAAARRRPGRARPRLCDPACRNPGDNVTDRAWHPPTVAIPAQPEQARRWQYLPAACGRGESLMTLQVIDIIKDKSCARARFSLDFAPGTILESQDRQDVFQGVFMADERIERTKALDVAVSQIEKQFGKGSIMRLGQKGGILPVDVIPTGAISLDFALGVGGMPRGRVVEIYGPESSGKTTLALQVIAQAQKLGGMAAFVDAEHALDATYAQKLGVDLDNLLVSQPDNGEQALEIVEVLVRSGGLDVVVVDSVAALVPRAEIEGEMGEAQMGLQARLMSQALRKLTGVVSKSKTCLVFINQLREKIGVMFGNPETTTGGRALKFYSSVRLDIRRIASIKDGEQVVGGRTRVKVVKNKVAAPFREAEFDIIYGEGISKEGDLLDLAVERKIVEKSGTWFSYGGERLGQGRENAKQFLKENTALCAGLEVKVRAELGLPARGAAAAAEAEARERAREARARPQVGASLHHRASATRQHLGLRRTRMLYCFSRHAVDPSAEVAQLVEHLTEN